MFVRRIDRNNVWEGLFSELLEALNGIVSEAIKRSKGWPTKPRSLSTELRRIAPNLRAEGIEVTFAKHREKGTPVRLERVQKSPSVPSVQSDAHETKRLQPDGRPPASIPNRQTPSGIVSRNGSNPLNGHATDDADDTDGLFATSSCQEERL
jgi:hypothetical protein